VEGEASISMLLA